MKKILVVLKIIGISIGSIAVIAGVVYLVLPEDQKETLDFVVKNITAPSDEAARANCNYIITRTDEDNWLCADNMTPEEQAMQEAMYYYGPIDKKRTMEDGETNLKCNYEAAWTGESSGIPMTDTFTARNGLVVYHGCEVEEEIDYSQYDGPSVVESY